MTFPLTSQDELPFSAGYVSFVNGPSEGEVGNARVTFPHSPPPDSRLWKCSCRIPYPALTYPLTDTWEASYPADYQSSTHHEPRQFFYDQAHTIVSHLRTNDPPPIAFAAPAPTGIGDMRGGQPIPSLAYAPPSDAQYVSMNAPVTAAVAPASNAAPLASATQVTTQRRFGCPMCPKTFERVARAEACHNKHLGWKPYVCQGACGNIMCNATFGSIENRDRHSRPPAERKVACPNCTRSFLKQNISRHKKSCV